MMLVRPECQYVLSNLAAGYTRNFVLPLIVGGVKLQIFGKNRQVHLIIVIIINNSLILRNLNNFPWCILFDLPPPPLHPPTHTQTQLGTKEYLTWWLKIIYLYIEPNWKYCLGKDWQCYKTNTDDVILKSILHSFLLPLVPQGKPLPDYSFSPPDL